MLLDMWGSEDNLMESVLSLVERLSCALWNSVHLGLEREQLKTLVAPLKYQVPNLSTHLAVHSCL